MVRISNNRIAVRKPHCIALPSMQDRSCGDNSNWMPVRVKHIVADANLAHR